MLKQGFTALFVGLLFGLGLIISGMTQPAKVIGFLDFFGAWDPTLIFVMMGGIGVHFFAYRIAKHRESPFFDDVFHLPTARDIDLKLILGAGLFGIGWGIAGFCPGPALTSLATLDPLVLSFGGAMILGMWLHYFFVEKRMNDR